MHQRLTRRPLLVAVALCASLSPAFAQAPPASNDSAELWCSQGAGEHEHFRILDSASELTGVPARTTTKWQRDTWPKDTIICEPGQRLSAK